MRELGIVELMGRVLVATLTLVLTLALGAPRAEARPESGCPRFRPAPLQVDHTEESGQGRPVSKVTDRHTSREPLTVEYEQGPNLWVGFGDTWHPIVEDSAFHNLQVASRRSAVDLNIRIEWATPSVSDIDLGLYDAEGKTVRWSGAFNNVVLDTAWSTAFGPYSGGAGFEEIRDLTVERCAGFTIESWSFLTLGENLTLKVWLSEPERF